MMLLTLPARPVRQDERISRVERDLAKLEGIVEQLVLTMDTEHRIMKESRQEDRAALKELGQKMERSVASLAEEMKKLADRNAAVDSSVLAKQSQALGAIAVMRWTIATGLAGGMLLLTYQAGQNNKQVEPQKHHTRIVTP